MVGNHPADLRLAEVASPRPGDRIEFDGTLHQGEPKRDRERLIWTVDLGPGEAETRHHD